MLFLKCPSNLQCIIPIAAVKPRVSRFGWAVEGMGLGTKEQLFYWTERLQEYLKGRVVAQSF